MKAKPQQVINAMDTSAHFNKLAELMCKDAPPAAYDKAILARMARLGIVPCKPFEMSKLPADVQAALADVGKEGMKLARQPRVRRGVPLHPGRRRRQQAGR